jgi:hypothetical protein
MEVLGVPNVENVQLRAGAVRYVASYQSRLLRVS